MKILILANNDVGLYQFRKELIKELKKNNDVYLSLPYGELVEPLKRMGCHYIKTPLDRRGLNPFKDFILLLRYLILLSDLKPDLVITYTIKPNIYGGFSSRILKIPYAINITGLGTAFQKEGILKKFVIGMYRIALKDAKVVFFENQENRQIFIDNHIVKENNTVLLNGAGVNLKHYQVFAYPMDTEETRFLFIGRVMKEKGVDELFESMKILISQGINCSLDVLGEYEENYKDEIEAYEKEGWLRYHGYQKDVRPFIKNAHCFVLPSWHEGMANTNLECAASGRPVITSDIHGCKEAIAPGVSGFLCQKGNAEDLYRIMKAFIELSPMEKQKMGLEGRKRMEALFDKKIVVDNTIRNL